MFCQISFQFFWQILLRLKVLLVLPNFAFVNWICLFVVYKVSTLNFVVVCVPTYLFQSKRTLKSNSKSLWCKFSPNLGRNTETSLQIFTVDDKLSASCIVLLLLDAFKLVSLDHRGRVFVPPIVLALWQKTRCNASIYREVDDNAFSDTLFSAFVLELRIISSFCFIFHF